MIRKLSTLIALSVICAGSFIIALPVAAQDNPTPTRTPVTAQAVRSVNVRSGPGTGYDVIDALQMGDVVNVVGRNDLYGNWLLIESADHRGWVAFFTVIVTGDADSVAIVDVDAVEDLEIGLLPPPLPPTPQADGPLYITAYRRVNVRSGPGTGFPTIGFLEPGSTADIVGSSGIRNQWLEIEFEDDTGWVAFFVVNVSGDLDTIATRRQGDDIVFSPPTRSAPSDSPETTVDEHQVIVITRFNTNFRSDPNLEADVLAVIPYGTTLEAVSRTQDNNWLQVIYEGEPGWLITSLVNPGVSNIDDLPVTARANPPQAIP